MNLTRRNVLALGGMAITSSLIPLNVALGDEHDIKVAIEEFTNGAPISEEGVTLTLPELVEDGNLVPISIDAAGATSIVIFAPENPVAKVGRFNFGE